MIANTAISAAAKCGAARCCRRSPCCMKSPRRKSPSPLPRRRIDEALVVALTGNVSGVVIPAEASIGARAGTYELQRYWRWMGPGSALRAVRDDDRVETFQSL